MPKAGGTGTKLALFAGGKDRTEAAAFCGLVLVFGSKLVSCDAAGLPFGMVSEPRRTASAAMTF